jgi:gliding motility-associated-like protein
VQAVTIADAGSDQQLCNVTAATLAANTPTSGTGTWTAAGTNPSAVTFINPNDPATNINGLTAGTYTFFWTISNAVCSESTDSVQIIVYPPTLAGTLASAATVCASANTGSLSLTGFVSSVLRWESSPDGTVWNNIVNNTGTLSYTNLTAATSYRTYVQNAVCPALYSNTVTINVVQAVTIADAGSDQQLCNVTAATLAANTPTSGTGTWTATGTNPSAVTFTNPNDPATNINGLTAGTFTFFWTISNAVCSESKDSVQIIVYPPTLAGTLASAATVCATANTGSLSLTGFVSSVLRWESSPDGTVWNNIVNNTGILSYTNLTAATSYRTYVQNAVCPALYSNTVTINVVQAVTIADAGSDQQLCNVTAATLAANTPTSGTGTWTAAGTNPSAVTFINPNDPATNINGLTAGTYTFFWTISNAVCSESTDSVQIIVYPSTVAGNLVADAFVCISGNNGTVKLTGYTGRVTQWEVSTDSTAWNAIVNTTDSLIYTNLLSTTYYRAFVQNGICNTVQTNIVSIHVNPVSVGGKLIPARDTVCATANTGSLKLSGFTGVIMRWEYSTDNGNNWTSVNNSDTTYNYTNLTNTTWYRVMIQSGVCSSAYSDTAIITVDSPTVIGILADNAVVCATSNNGKISVTGKTGAVIHWEVSVDNGNTWSIISNTADSLIYTNLTTTSQYRALIQNGVCAILYSNSVVISVIQPVTIANAGPDQVLCNANADIVLQANTPSSGTGIWNFVSGPSTVSFTNQAAVNTAASGLKTGTYLFSWTISNGTCPSSTDTVIVKIDRVISGFNVASVNDCGKTTFFYTNTSLSAFGIQNWKWFTNGGDSATSKNYTLAFTSETSEKTTLAVQSITGCTDTISALHDVVVYQFPKVNINAVSEICKSQLLRISPDVSSQDSIAFMLWNLGNGTKANDPFVNVQYVEDGYYTVRLTVATVNRCFDSAYKQIMVHPIPDILISSNPIVCKGDSTTLTASGAKSYIWTDQNNNIICNGCTSTRVKPTYNTQYRVVGYSEYGCSQVKATDVRVIPALKMLAIKGDTLCIGEAAQLHASGAANYNWYPAAGLNSTSIASPVANPATTTVYHVIGKDEFNCFIDTAEIRVAVGVPTPLNIGKDTVITAGTVFQFNPSPASQDIRKWIWKSPVELSCRNCPAPQARISNDVDITLTVINAYGCVSNDTISIKTFCGATELFVPNAFSPDGDGINDVLLVQGKGVKMVKSFKIFSRWGELVFERSNFVPGDRSAAWDGKIRGNPAPPDVFVYIAEVICEKGLPSSFKGNVAILK